jgi:hypothetical protein
MFLLMKKILWIVVLGLFLTINPAYSKVGKGNLTFSPEVLENFLKYLRNELATSFVVTKDGKFALYGLCRDKSRGCQGGPGSTATLMKNCKKEYGEKCFIFAQRKKFKSDPSSSYIDISKKIRWNNVDYEFPKEKTWKGMGYGESKGEGIKKDISDDQIKSVLNELGFINFNKVVASIDTNNDKLKIKKSKNARASYYCIWYDEYYKVYRFTDNKISPATCADRELYIVKESEHKKIYNSLKWKFKNDVKDGDDPVAKVPKKLFLKIEKQIPKIKKIDKKIINKDDEITKITETTIISKVEKKLTKQQQIEIDQIKEMLDIGALTKDEYDAAIKRALN